MLRLIFALAVSLAACATAPIDEAEPTAAPGSIAYGMIDEAGAEGVFEAVPNGQVSVRHVQSGIQCDFARTGDGGGIALLSGMPRGDGASCSWELEQGAFELSAQRRPQSLAQAIAALRAQFPRARLQRQSEAPPYDSASFFADLEGHPSIVGIKLARAGDWTFQIRYTTRAAQSTAADSIASAILQGAIADAAQAQPVN